MRKKNMPKLNKPTESTGGLSIDKGVILSTGTIIKVVDKSTNPDYPNREKVMTSKGNPVEILLEVTYKDETEQERTKKIFGFYEYDKIDIRIINWRAWGNDALNFVTALLSEDTIEKGLTDNFGIKQSLLDALSGKAFKEVRYVTGSYLDDEGKEKLSYNTFNFFDFKVSDDDVKKAWEARKSKLKNYKPALVDKVNPKSDVDTTFSYGDNVAQDDVI